MLKLENGLKSGQNDKILVRDLNKKLVQFLMGYLIALHLFLKLLNFRLQFEIQSYLYCLL